MDRLRALPLKLLVICGTELGHMYRDAGVPSSLHKAYKRLTVAISVPT